MQHLCLASFTYYIAFIVHQCYSMQSYFNHFYGWKLLHCIDIHFIYLFINWWTFGLSLLFGTMDSKFLWTCFISLGYILQVKLMDHLVTLTFNILRDYQVVFQSGCTTSSVRGFPFPPAVYEVYNFLYILATTCCCLELLIMTILLM